MLTGNRCQLRLVERGAEAFDAVVAGVRLEQQRGTRANGFAVVARVGAVGGANLAQLAAGAGHDVRQTEGAADFDQLTARDHHLAAVRQRVEHQQHGSGVVVDHRRGFRAGQAADPLLDMIITVATLTAGQIELQIARAEGDRIHRRHRFRRQGRAAQIGMQHRPGQVQHRSHGRRQRRQQVLTQPVHQCLVVADLAAAPQLQRGTHTINHQCAAVIGNQLLHQRPGQYPVDRGWSVKGGRHATTLGSVCVAALQQAQNLCQRAIGKRAHFIVGAVLNRMRNKDHGRIKAKGLRLQRRGLYKFTGGNPYSRDLT